MRVLDNKMRYGPRPIQSVADRCVRTPRYLSPLRYPGGKQRLASYFERLIAANYKKPPRYIEPFAGGAGVALHLLVSGAVRTIHLNDLDRSVYAFWHSVLTKPCKLCALIKARRISVSEWDRQKEVQKSKADAPLLELGFSTLFLNRSNRSGILRGGMIGGRSQSGAWKIGARFDKTSLISRIEFISSYAKQITISNLDCLVEKDLSFGHKGKPFVYFDPPYYDKGRDLYLNHFTPSDHEILSKRIVGATSLNWAVTYDDVPQVRKLYAGFRSERYALSYTADKFRRGAERIYLSNGLSV